MRIAIAHYSSRSDISGVTSWIIGFCNRLRARGHTIGMHLHHYGPDINDASIISPLQDMGVELFPVIRTGNLKQDARATLRFLNEFQPDLFLPQCEHAHFFAAAEGGRHGLPWVMVVHSDDPEYWCAVDALAPDRFGGSTVCVSKVLASIASERYSASNVTVIPYGVPLPSSLARPCVGEPFRVVFSGRLESRQKRIFDVVEVLLNACRLSSNIEAELIGDGPDHAECVRIVAEAGLEKRILFPGRLPPHEVPKKLQSAHALILMSAFEGLPLAVLEAMAAGVVPVVRRIESGIPELVYHEMTGLLAPDDPHEAARVLVRLSEDPDLWVKCSRNARSLIEQSFSADHCFGLWEDLINQFNNRSKSSFAMPSIRTARDLPFGDPRFQNDVSDLDWQIARLPPLGFLRRILRLLRRILS